MRGMLGKGRSTSPLRSAAASSARGEKKAEPGALLGVLWPKRRRGQAARRRHGHPLGRAHADEGANDGAGALYSLSSSFALRSAARCCCAEERQVRGEERERGRKRMGLGFSGGRCRCVFVRAISPLSRRIERAFSRPRRASAPRGFAGPGCGLGAGSARIEKWAGPKEQ